MAYSGTDRYRRNSTSCWSEKRVRWWGLREEIEGALSMAAVSYIREPGARRMGRRGSAGGRTTCPNWDGQRASVTWKVVVGKRCSDLLTARWISARDLALKRVFPAGKSRYPPPHSSSLQAQFPFKRLCSMKCRLARQLGRYTTTVLAIVSNTLSNG